MTTKKTPPSKMPSVNTKDNTNNVPEEITRETIIGDIMSQYPYAAEIFMDYGIHCVGCSASSFETMEQGIIGHGFSEGELLDILKELNEAILNPPEEFEDLIF